MGSFECRVVLPLRGNFRKGGVIEADADAMRGGSGSGTLPREVGRFLSTDLGLVP